MSGMTAPKAIDRDEEVSCDMELHPRSASHPSTIVNCQDEKWSGFWWTLLTAGELRGLLRF